MDTLFCEVIGCGKKAVWKLLPGSKPLPTEPLLEENICSEHRQQLARLHPDLAAYFVPLENGQEEDLAHDQAVVQAISPPVEAKENSPC